jgi:CheY-like chemotaxis protein
MKKILLLDNSEVDRLVLRAQLAHLGHGDVTETDNVPTALRLIEAQGFDLVFTDCDMQPFDGLYFVRSVRETLGLVRLPMVMTTTRTDVCGTLQEYQVGYLKKPVDLALLKRWLEFFR